jgi:hypothetical protein
MKLNRLHVAFCLVNVLLTTASCSRYHGLAEADAEQLMAKEAPVGSEASKVVAFLDSRGLQHSDIVDLPEATLARPGGDTLFWSAKLDGKRERIRHYIWAKIPNIGGPGIFTTWNMSLRFYLDGDGKVVAHQAKKIGTSF